MTFDDIHNTQQLANAAETFVRVLRAHFPEDTFEQVVHGKSLHRAYWQALHRALDAYATAENVDWVRGLMGGDVLANERVAEELLKFFLPEVLPDYGVIADLWARALQAGAHVRALLGREAEQLFTLLADELRQSPDVRVVLHQLAQDRARSLSGLFDKLSTQEADLLRLLDAALVSGPSTLGLQVRHLLALAGERHPNAVGPNAHGLEALVGLAAHVPNGALTRIWQVVLTVENPLRRVQLAGGLVLPMSRAGLIDDPLAAVMAVVDDSRDQLDPAVVVRVLLDLAPHLASANQDVELPSFQARMFDAVRGISDPASQLRALGTLIHNLPPPLQGEAVAMAFETAACCIPGEVARANSLSALPAYLPPEGLERLLEIADELETPDSRALLLGRTLPHLPPPLQLRALSRALDAIEQINGDDARTQGLIALAPHIDAMGPLSYFPDGLHGALSAMFSISRPDDRARAFAALAPYLSPELLGEALHLVKGISDEFDRASTLVQLAPHLPDDLLVAAFGVAQELMIPDRRAAALAAIAPYLQPAARQQALGLALAASLAVEERYARVEVLVDLAPHLPDELKERAMQDALTATRSIPNEFERARALVFLAPHLLHEQFADAVADAYTILDPLELVSALSALMPHLPEEPGLRVGVDMIRRARALGEVHYKAGILASLAPVLPEQLVDEAWQAAEAIDLPYERMHVLTALLPRDPEKLRQPVLAAARTVVEPFERVNVLLELVPHVPPGLRHEILHEALDVALHVTDDYDRASALAAFGPYVSANSEVQDRQQDGLSLALDACLQIADPTVRTALLGHLARAWVELLQPGQAYTLWRSVMVFLRDRPYDEVMAALAALAPVLETMTAPGTIEEIAQALLAQVLNNAAGDVE